MQERDRDKLVEAVIIVGHEVHEMHKAFTAAAAALISNKSILERIAQAERNIMSAISEFATKQNAFNDRLDAAVTGLSGDVQALNDKITELQNTAGQITPEDQALLDNIQQRSEAIATKIEALDSLTPPAPPAA
jgi:hypothetical protein